MWATRSWVLSLSHLAGPVKPEPLQRLSLSAPPPNPARHRG